MKWLFFILLIGMLVFFGYRLIIETIKWEHYIQDKERKKFN